MHHTHSGVRVSNIMFVRRIDVDNSQLRYVQYKGLHASRFISSANLREKEGELLDQQQRLTELRRILLTMERDAGSMQDSVTELALQQQRDGYAIARSISALEQELTENEARRRIFVRAKQAGIVSTVGISSGQHVSPNQLIASIVPTRAELEAEIYVSSSSVGFIKPGMDVLLRYHAYPYQKFGLHAAVVRTVANTALPMDELTLGGGYVPKQHSEPVYRVRLKLKNPTVKAYGKRNSP